jgi:hypothetical protein
MTFTPPTLSAAARYRICINGAIHPARLIQLCGIWTVAPQRNEDANQSVLTGFVIDQAELMGLLNQLYSYGLPLVSLEYLGSVPNEVVAK